MFDSGQAEGPYDDNQLLELVKLGKVKAKTIVMHGEKTRGQWYEANRLPALNKLFQQLDIDKEKLKQEKQRQKSELAIKKKELAVQQKQVKLHQSNIALTTRSEPLAQPAVQSQPHVAHGSDAPAPQLQVAINQGAPQQTVVVHHVQQKSAAVAFLLAFFFGPFGMFYSTVVGALVCLGFGLIVIPIISTFTLGLGLFLYIPYYILCIVWAMIAC